MYNNSFFIFSFIHKTWVLIAFDTTLVRTRKNLIRAQDLFLTPSIQWSMKIVISAEWSSVLSVATPCPKSKAIWSISKMTCVAKRGPHRTARASTTLPAATTKSATLVSHLKFSSKARQALPLAPSTPTSNTFARARWFATNPFHYLHRWTFSRVQLLMSTSHSPPTTVPLHLITFEEFVASEPWWMVMDFWNCIASII